MSKYLITGTAGFIGFHLSDAIIKQGDDVVGLDNINDYYDKNLKYARLKAVGIDREDIDWNKFSCSKLYPNYRFIKADIKEKENLLKLFAEERFDYIVHLAAQAGVRYSIDNPDTYIQSNIVGFYNILEACRHSPVRYLLYASSSSVYGNNEKVPFSEDDNVDHPISLYAATKKSNELMAETYRHLYGVNATGLRFFTVYGPWGRPDMAIYKFTDAILNNKPIQVYAQGTLLRDFTYIDDIITGMLSVLKRQSMETPPDIINIGNNNPVTVNELVSELEHILGREALIEYLPMQAGDVRVTYADIDRIDTYCGFKPQTDLRAGLMKFCDWYLNY